MRRYVWDPVKAAANEKKHGIPFESAVRVFADPFAIVEQDRVEGFQERWQAIGSAGGMAVLLVAHTTTDTDDGVEVVQIISARPTTKAERKRYENEARGI